MIRCLQTNQNRCWAASNLLYQFVSEHEVDICFISEAYNIPSDSRWFTDVSGTASIWIINPSAVEVTGHCSENGFVAIETRDCCFISCYLSPNITLVSYCEKLESLDEFIVKLEKQVILAGDFNAKSEEWGEDRNDVRGRELAEMAARLNLIILNTGSVTTFRRPGRKESILDISLASPGVAKAIRNWEVLEDYNASDHQYISFQVMGSTTNRLPGKRGAFIGWNTNKLDKQKLLAEINKGISSLDRLTSDSPDRNVAEVLATNTTKLIVQACNRAMPRKYSSCKRKPAYWWTNEIALLRSECLAKRRKATRAQRKLRSAGKCAELELYKAAKKSLNKAIKDSKKECWKKLCNDLDNNPWGRGYQIVVKKLGLQAPVGLKDHRAMTEILKELFPQHQQRTLSNYVVETEIPVFTRQELIEATSSMANNKAPGPDKIPVPVIKLIAKEQPNILLNMYNSCLKAGVFCRPWKIQKLVLLDKGKPPPKTPSSYRPLCMLDVLGKVLEKLIRSRLREAIERKGGLSKNQHGFIKGHSTIDAIMETLEKKPENWDQNARARKVRILLTFDVKNAFNSLRWIDILHALELIFDVPKYIVRLFSDYLDKRFLLYETIEGQSSMEVTAGAAQGSVAGPDLWNDVYDDLLGIDTPEETFLVGYADDVAAVVFARSVEQAQRRIAVIIDKVRGWLTDHGLQLAAQKTEVVVITRQKWFPTPFTICMDDTTITASKSVRYLGVTVDDKLTFTPHLKAAAEKGLKTYANLSRLLPNIGGPSYQKRILLVSVIQSTLLYGAEVWADALKIESNRHILASVQRRGALRVTSAYRTVSEAAVLVLAGTPPIDLLARERKRLFALRKANALSNETKVVEKNKTLKSWEKQWKTSLKGRWTVELIPDLVSWVRRKHGDMNYFLTQFFTGHGVFMFYLHKMKRWHSPKCLYCEDMIDNAQHTFFDCRRWNEYREQIDRKLGVRITPENIVKLMLMSKPKWAAVAAYVETVLRTKRSEFSEFEKATCQ